MDHRLLNKYFRDECTDEELDKVLDWFQTKEGQAFLEEDMEDLDQKFPAKGYSNPLSYSDLDTERIFNRIQLSKKKDHQKDSRVRFRVASILVLVAVLSSLLYWGGIISPGGQEPEYTTYITEQDQQKVLTLSDGTRIRLNAGAKLVVPEKLERNERIVELKGEAYFEVESNGDRPFLVKTAGSVVEVLGTKFNVKADTAAGHIQVAVVEGKVALKSGDTKDAASALLTPNNFGILRLSDSQITIEKVNTENYISWFSNRLVFSGETLAQVSRQLERLYDIEIEFKSQRLKTLQLTADMEKVDLREVLTTISNTFDIQFSMNEQQVAWME